tara:strand:- start:903 stop:1064 length:162 start_codon:yes stop_codon:yes gene_type:complete
MFSTKEVLIIVSTIIGLLALLATEAGRIDSDEFMQIFLILVGINILHRFFGKN